MILVLVTLLSAGDCQGCHERQYREWSGSRHAASFSNAIFAASYAREPMRWCLTCHAPLPEQIRAVGQSRHVEEVADPLPAEGVTCVSCHIENGRVLSRRELAAPDFCARCHQFDFPGSHEPMQDTVAEWRRSGSAERCQDCHMPSGEHRFPGAHDREFLRRAVSASVVAEEGGAVVRLASRGAAHRVPTGDPFRRLYVELCEEPSCDEPLARPAFARRFAPDGDSWRLTSDEALPPDGEIVRHVKLERPARYFRLMFGYAAASSAPSLSSEDWAVELASGRVR